MRILKSLFTLMLVSLLFSFPLKSGAQDQGSGGESVGDMDFGFQVGNLLPNQIAGMTEITGVGGGHFAMRATGSTFAEVTLLTGNGGGARWRNLAVSYRIEMPIDTFVAGVLVGLDLTLHAGNGKSETLAPGGHVGGVLLSQLGGSTWIRADMKFQAQPGTSLYIGFGVMFRL